MAVQLAEGVTLEGYSAAKTSDVESLAEMYVAYLLEEFKRIGEMAFGNPVSGYLLTMILRCEGEAAGFAALDVGRSAVEIIYVKPELRARGLATLALSELKRHSPRTLALKTPLSPGGEALCDRLELDRADNFPDEAAKNEEALRMILAAVKRRCDHKVKQSGDPRKPCKSCYQKAMRQYGNAVVHDHAEVARLS